jgi:hypothetical protein
MSISRLSQPNTFAFSNDRLLFTYSSTEIAQPGFRFVVVVTVGSQSMTSYIQPNPSNHLIFDASTYVRDLVVVDEFDSNLVPIVSAIYTAPIKFRCSNKAAGKVVVSVQEYYNNALQGTANTYTMYLAPGHGQIYEGQNANRATYIASNGTGVGWLTSRSQAVYTMGDGVTTPSVRVDMSPTTEGWMVRAYGTAVGVGSHQIRYRIYNGASVVATHTVDLNTTNGAAFASGSAVPSTGNFLLYIPVGPAHINGLFGTNMATTTWTHMRISNMYSGVALEDILVVNEDDSCKHEDVWVLFWNRVGGLDALKFNARRQEERSFEHKNIVRPIGRYGSTSGLYYSTERTTEAYAATGRITHTLLKHGITPQESALFGELAASKMVWAKIGGRWRPMYTESTNAPIVVGTSSKIQTAEISLIEAQELRC